MSAAVWYLLSVSALRGVLAVSSLAAIIVPRVLAQGLKIGDLDPRCDPGLCNRASDKALAVGGGVLEALLSRPKIRSALGRPGK